ncbi:MAG: hypothetical protein R3182_09880, partial [Draconibacterium sp.]|nr:hypothetical protein [Draconibacterium sp.]
MKKILQLLLFIIFIASPAFATVQTNNLTELLTNGKWVNRSDGYVPIPTYDPQEKTEKKPVTRKRFKTFGFEENGTFLLDSAKQRYTGHYRIVGDKVHLDFNPVKITHLRTNTDPNNQGGYQTVDEMVTLSERELFIGDDGNLTGDGFVYKNYNGAFSGLFNFYEFSGFANFSWGHIIMMIVGFVFIFLAI